jgi:hypothetical protein
MDQPDLDLTAFVEPGSLFHLVLRDALILERARPPSEDQEGVICKQRI